MSVHPRLGYRDARAAIAFLCEAFGFELRMLRPGEAPGSVAHAELALGPDVLLLDTRADAGRGSVYVALDQVDGHCERARAAGARIAAYSAYDLEGNVWSFGTYRPTPR